MAVMLSRKCDMTTLACLLRSPFLAVLAATLSLPALAQQADPPKCRYSKLATLPVSYMNPTLQPTIVGSINGKPADMLVNTSSFDVLLTRTAAERHGLNLWPTKQISQDLGGHSRIYTTRVREFQAGLATMKNGDLELLGDSGSPPSYEAVLGASFLLQTDFEISLATKEIRLFKPSNCENRSLAYWDQNALELPFLPGSQLSENPAFTVLVNGKKVKAVISSGSAFTAMTRPAASRIGLQSDAPGAEDRMVHAGSKSIAFWKVKLDTLQLGDELIQNAEIGVVDGDRADIDLILGADFLRSHRVLFAMSQQKLYFSYVGGAPLGPMQGIQPWLQQEADNGNGDAQMMLANLYGTGTGVPLDQAKADAWVARAVGAGHPRALVFSGARLAWQGRYADAVAPLRQGLDGLPGDRNGALWLYVARMRTGQAELAQRELESAFARASDDWPGPIAAFYLGKLDEKRLLEQARASELHAAERTCRARTHIAEQYAIAGEHARAAALRSEIEGCDGPRPRPA